MLRNVGKMTVVRLLLCSVLLYNTEASIDDWYDETSAGAETGTAPKTSDWYYGSDTVHKNETRNYEIEPEKDKRPPSPSDNKTTDWYYGSNDKNKPRHNEFPYPTTLSNATSNLTDAKVVKPYNDDVGYLTVDNGILTAHGLTLKDDDKENNSDKVGWSNDWFSDIVKKTASTTRPYNSYRYDKIEHLTTTETPYYKYNNSVVDYETVSQPAKPYYWYGDKEIVDDRNKTAVHYGYNIPVVNFETTTTRRPYYRHWDKQFEIGKNKTAVPYYVYNNTAKESETTTTRRPHYWWTGTKIAKESVNTTIIKPHHWWTGTKIELPNSVTIPSYRYDKTVEKSETTTAKRSPYENAKEPTTPRNPWYYGTKTPPNDVGSTPRDPKDYISSAHVNYKWAATVSPIVNETNSLNVTTDKENPKTPNSRGNPINISINSSINGNEARNYGAFADLLKKMAGYILPYTNNIAPNSSITNLAVANGNGNVFFYVG